jgi:hypothetical protein
MSTAPETRTRYGAPELDDAFDAELERMALAQAEPPLEEPPYGHGLARYLRYKVQDFLKHRATLLLPIALIGLWIFRDNYDPSWLDHVRERPGRTPPTEPQYFRNLVMTASIIMGGMGSILSVFGIVSREREGGFQRFLFAKPIRITSYYLQTFVVNGIGLLASSALVLGITSLVFLRPVPFLEPLALVAALYVGIGGLTFLLSTLVRFDFALAVVLSAMAVPLHAASDRGYWWAMLTSWMFPPLHVFEGFDPDRNMANKPSMGSAIGSLVVYGMAYISIGIAVLKRRSIIR